MRYARLSPEERKAEILGMARKVLGEVFHESFLPLRVAERCGISEATVYRYFPTKQDLLVAIAEEWVSELISMHVALDEFEDIFSRLKCAIRHSLETVNLEPAIARFIFISVRIDPNYRNTKLYKLIAQFTSLTTKVIEEGMRKGFFRDDVPIQLVRDLIFGAIEHQMWPYLRHEVDPPPLDKVAEKIAQMIYRGLATSSPVKIELFEKSISRMETSLDSIKDEILMLEKAVDLDL